MTYLISCIVYFFVLYSFGNQDRLCSEHKTTNKFPLKICLDKSTEQYKIQLNQNDKIELIQKPDLYIKSKSGKLVSISNNYTSNLPEEFYVVDAYENIYSLSGDHTFPVRIQKIKCNEIDCKDLGYECFNSKALNLDKNAATDIFDFKINKNDSYAINPNFESYVLYNALNGDQEAQNKILNNKLDLKNIPKKQILRESLIKSVINFHKSNCPSQLNPKKFDIIKIKSNANYDLLIFGYLNEDSFDSHYVKDKKAQIKTLKQKAQIQISNSLSKNKYYSDDDFLPYNYFIGKQLVKIPLVSLDEETKTYPVYTEFPVYPENNLNIYLYYYYNGKPIGKSLTNSINGNKLLTKITDNNLKHEINNLISNNKTVLVLNKENLKDPERWLRINEIPNQIVTSIKDIAYKKAIEFDNDCTEENKKNFILGTRNFKSNTNSYLISVKSCDEVAGHRIDWYGVTKNGNIIEILTGTGQYDLGEPVDAIDINSDGKSEWIFKVESLDGKISFELFDSKFKQIKSFH